MDEAFALSVIKQAMEKALKCHQNHLYQDAEIILKQVLRAQHRLDALKLLALTIQSQEKFQEAIEIHLQSLEICSNDSQIHNNLGLCWSGIGDFENAIFCLKQAIELKPDFPAYYNNLALQYRQTGQLDSAKKCFEKSLELSSEAKTWGMLGGIYGEMKCLKKAEQCFHKALSLDPSLSTVHVDLSYVYSLRGEWDKAWQEYEYRYECFPQIQKWRELYGKNRWEKNQDISGKKIIIYCEQGAGDAIHFSRYLPLIRKKGARKVLVHCPPGMGIENILKPLSDEVISMNPGVIKRSDLPEFDLYASILSLPWLLDNPPFPETPYIKTTSKIDFPDYNCLKIGICWAGNPQHPNDINRSIPLEFFQPIHDIPGVKLFSLQKDLQKRMYRFHKEPVDLSAGNENMKIVDMSEYLKDFADTAAIIENMDLIISVDTAVLHLTGAMGKKAFGLIPSNPDWRWKISGSKTEWYPEITLFRRETTWEEAIYQICEEIKASYANILSNK